VDEEKKWFLRHLDERKMSVMRLVFYLVQAGEARRCQYNADRRDLE
jgi:hypothetical protein